MPVDSEARLVEYGQGNIVKCASSEGYWMC